jgi:hypothetical protein
MNRVVEQQQWLQETNPLVLLALLDHSKWVYPTTPVARLRQLRLWGCACCRLAWKDLSSESQDLLLAVEKRLQCPQMKSTRDVFINDVLFAFAQHLNIGPSTDLAPETCLARAVIFTCRTDVFEAHKYLRQAYLWQPDLTVRHAALLREVIGNPFEEPHLGLANTWKTWHNGLLPILTQTILQQRDFSLLPILADALEEFGCQDAGILEHCRAGTTHALGCWALDLLLEAFHVS